MNTQPHQEIEDIEITIKEAQEMVDRKNKVLKLKADPAFQELFMQGFVHDFALTCLQMSSSIAVDERTREQVCRDMHGPSTMLRYLDGILAQGTAAENTIAISEEQISTIQEENAGFVAGA